MNKKVGTALAKGMREMSEQFKQAGAELYQGLFILGFHKPRAAKARAG